MSIRSLNSVLEDKKHHFVALLEVLDECVAVMISKNPDDSIFSFFFFSVLEIRVQRPKYIFIVPAMSLCKYV